MKVFCLFPFSIFATEDKRLTKEENGWVFPSMCKDFSLNPFLKRNLLDL